ARETSKFLREPPWSLLGAFIPLQAADDACCPAAASKFPSWPHILYIGATHSHIWQCVDFQTAVDERGQDDEEPNVNREEDLCK
ncbi:hypothetical protein V3C99_001180, partial [Haemonchus contortus]